LPSDLLHRRPDLIAAERQLAASLERVKIAKKDLLPTISLSSSTGTSSGELRDILDPDLLIWNIAGNLTQPIFQGGRLLAGIDLANANSRSALANYAQVALNAFRELESLLAAEGFLQDELSASEQAAIESVAAEELAWQQYQRGLVDIITVLESQRRAFTAQSSLLSVMNNRLANRINLYLALGGNFALVKDPAEGPSHSEIE
jgi:outer membrane protein TolC